MTFFDFQRPVHGRGRYVGRETLVRSLVGGFERHRSFTICGGPQTGRSSTLFQVIHTIQERWKRQPSAVKVVPVLLDLGELVARDARARPGGLAAMLWDRMVEAIRDPLVCGRAPIVTAPEPDFKRSANPWKTFRESARTLWDTLAGTESWCEYGVLLDNGDLLLTRRLEPSVEPLAELVRELGPWLPGSLTVAGGRSLREYLLDEETPLGFARPVFLGALRDTEAESLVRAGLKEIDDELLGSLLLATGKHPFVLQRLCAELELRGVKSGVDQAVEIAAGDCLRLFDEIWSQFDLGRGVTYRGAYAAPEHALMQLLIDVGAGMELLAAQRELGIQSLKEYAEFLEMMGVAERSILGDRVHYRPHFDLWNLWYSERIMR